MERESDLVWLEMSKRYAIWGDPNHQELRNFSLTEIWFQPERRWWFTQPSSLRDMKVYEGFLKWGYCRDTPKSSGLFGFSMNEISHPFSGPFMEPPDHDQTEMSLRSSALIREALPWWTWRKAWCGRGQDTLDGGLLKEQRNRGRWFQYVHTKHHKALSLGLWDSDPKLVHLSPVFQWALKPPTRSRKTHGFQAISAPAFPMISLCCRWNQLVPAVMLCSSA